MTSVPRPPRRHSPRPPLPPPSRVAVTGVACRALSPDGNPVSPRLRAAHARPPGFPPPPSSACLGLFGSFVPLRGHYPLHCKWAFRTISFPSMTSGGFGTGTLTNETEKRWKFIKLHSKKVRMSSSVSFNNSNVSATSHVWMVLCIFFESIFASP